MSEKLAKKKRKRTQLFVDRMVSVSCCPNYVVGILREGSLPCFTVSTGRIHGVNGGGLVPKHSRPPNPQLALLVPLFPNLFPFIPYTILDPPLLRIHFKMKVGRAENSHFLIRTCLLIKVVIICIRSSNFQKETFFKLHWCILSVQKEITTLNIKPT